MRDRYFVCYDVSDPQRLIKTYKKMCGYGDPVQYSVFSCDLNDKEIIYLKEDLGEILNMSEDRVLFINTGNSEKNKNGRITTMGVPIKKKEHVVVV